MSLAKDDFNDLRYAKILLENPSLAARISNLLGTPLEKGFEYLPSKWKSVVQKATEKSLEKALNFAIQTMNDRTRPASFDKTHKILVLATGAGGGSFGLPASYGYVSFCFLDFCFQRMGDLVGIYRKRGCP